MTEEAFSAVLVGLFGICSCDAFSWDQQSLLPPFLDVNPGATDTDDVVRFHLLPTFLFQSLIRLLWISHRGHSRSPSLAAHRGAPALAAHRRARHWQLTAPPRHRQLTAPASAAYRPAPPSVAIDGGGGASAALDFDYGALGRAFRIAGQP